MAISAPTRTVRDVFGRTHTLTPGLVDEAAVTAFTTGHCANLALALHAATGWDLVVLIEAASAYTTLSGAAKAVANAGCPLPSQLLDALWSHAMVRTPAGLLLDINGYADPDTLLAHYEGIEGGDGNVATAGERQRLVSASAAQVAGLPSDAPTFGTDGLGAQFTDAVLNLPTRARLPWPWHQSSARGGADLAEQVADLVADGWKFHQAATSVLAEFDEDTALLGELANRAMLTPELADIARAVLAAGTASAT